GRLLGAERAAAGSDAARAAAALPQARRRGSHRGRAPVIDTHAHLTSLEDTDEAIRRAAEAGVTRILTVGTNVDDCRRALSLAETDSPYLAPQPVRGKRNEPANVVHTLAALAQARGQEPAELERQIERNAAECFGL